MRAIDDRRPKRLATFLLVTLLGVATAALARESRYEGDHRHDSFVFATTRGVSEMDANPALKVTIVPLAIVIDLALLPFALLADLVTR